MSDTQANARPVVSDSARANVEEVLGPHLSMRSFIGCLKQCNEDFGALAEETIDGTTYCVMVVCDGVSSSWRPHLAAKAACITARDTILAQLRAGSQDLENCLKVAVNAAQKSVLAIHPTVDAQSGKPANGRKLTSETTFIAAIAAGGKVALVWLGDCRAYLLPRAGGAKLLTKDHSWINWMVEAKGMSVLEAMQAPEAHWITGCLGSLKTEFAPSYATADLRGSKLLLLCSDGFWNYGHPRQDQRATPLLDEMHALSAADADAAVIASRLVDFACESGGHDNITVAVLKLGSIPAAAGQTMPADVCTRKEQ